MRMTKGLAAIALLAALAVGPAQGVAWPSFFSVDCTGITVTPSLQSGTTGYTFCLQPGATVNGQPVQQILGFFAVGDPQAASFTATGSDVTGWNFESQTSSGYVAGWETTGNQFRVNPGQCKTLSFNSFAINSGGVLPGFHLQFIDSQGQSVTGYFKCTSTPTDVIPEVPAPLLGLIGSGAIAAVSAFRRYLDRR